MKIKLYQYDYNHLEERNRETFARIMFGDTPTQEEINSIYFKVAEINVIENQDILARDHSQLCETIFILFNMDDRPNGKYFRSMSVGDIVSIDNDKYICANFGFEKIESDLSLVSKHKDSAIYDESILNSL